MGPLFFLLIEGCRVFHREDHRRDLDFRLLKEVKVEDISVGTISTKLLGVRSALSLVLLRLCSAVSVPVRSYAVVIVFKANSDIVMLQLADVPSSLVSLHLFNGTCEYLCRKESDCILKKTPCSRRKKFVQFLKV